MEYFQAVVRAEPNFDTSCSAAWYTSLPFHPILIDIRYEYDSDMALKLVISRRLLTLDDTSVTTSTH